MVIYLLNFCFYMLQTPLALPGWRSRLAFAGADTGPSCQSRNQAPPFAYRLPFLALPRSSAPSPLRGFIRCGPAGPSLIGGQRWPLRGELHFSPLLPPASAPTGALLRTLLLPGPMPGPSFLPAGVGPGSWRLFARCRWYTLSPALTSARNSLG